MRILMIEGENPYFQAYSDVYASHQILPQRLPDGMRILLWWV
jgi:hypothetical protein